MIIPAEQPVGQNITYEFPGIQLKNSIIRSYDAKKSFIIYTDDGANRKFSYFDPTSSNDVSADFTSANVIVNDMKVVDDQVFFCGYSPSSPGAAFGYFDIGECRSEKSTDGWRLYLVPEFGNTNKRNSQYVIDVSSAYIMNSVQLLTPNDIDELHSLTINAGNETELSGTTTGALRVWQTATTNDACAQSTRVPFEHFWFPESNPIFRKYVGNGKYSYMTFYPIVVNVTRDYICK